MNAKAFAWFLRLWAAAAFAHFVGNPPTLRIGGAGGLMTVVAAATALTSIAVFLWPERRPTVALLCGLLVATAALEAPIVGNHQLICALVSLALLGALTRRDPWAAFAPMGRALFLVCYGFAAFSKFNRGFFDPNVSCALAYSNRWLESFHLPTIVPGTGLALAAAVMTAVVEALVPALLLMPKTRRFGVALGFLFHFAVSYDLQQHIYDFTAMLFALFTLFLPDVVLAQLGRLPKLKRPAALAVGVLTLGFVLAAILPAEEGSYWLLMNGAFLCWFPWSTALLLRTLGAVARLGSVQPLGRPSAVGAVLVAVAVFNGLSPYLELKTASGFNMYANLVTANGRSNHYLIPRTAHLSDVQQDPFVVLDTNDEGLGQYVDAGWAVPQERLRNYLAHHPGVTVTVSKLGSPEPLALTSADGVALPWWKDRFVLFRSIDVNDPPRCQLHWLPAY